MVPETPLPVLAAVANTNLPLPVDPAPLMIDKAPPSPPVDGPDVRDKSAPSATPLEPTDNKIDPACPAAFPVVKVNVPDVEATLDAPVETTTAPVPYFDGELCTVTAPLGPPDELPPLTMSITPPVPVLVNESPA